MADKDTVPTSEYLKIKNILKDKEKKWETAETNFKSQISQLQNEVKIAKANGENTEEVDLVKKHLVEQAEQIEKARSKLTEDSNSHTKREREFRAREIASDLKSRGVEVTVESLLDEENMDIKAKDLLVDHLAKENETLKKSPAPGESVFESGTGGILKKSVKDIDTSTPEGKKEFAQYEKQLREVALSRK